MPDKNAKIHVTALSFGAGIQSTALSLMLRDGLLPDYNLPDLAVFADTQSDPPNTYATLDWIEELLPFPLVRTSFSNLEKDTWNSIQGLPTPMRNNTPDPRTDLPVFSIGGGILRRQCTGNYKVRPIKRAVRQWAGANPPKLQVTQYIAISSDEAWRIKPAPESYITNVFPLAESRISRSDCLDYLNSRHPGHPAGKSSCFFCPFRNTAQWRHLQENYPDLFTRAARMDQALRDSAVRVSLVKHPHGLAALMAEDAMQGRLSLDEPDNFANECTGHCGV